MSGLLGDDSAYEKGVKDASSGGEGIIVPASSSSNIASASATNNSAFRSQHNPTIGEYRASKPKTNKGLSFFKVKSPRVTSPYYATGRYYNSTMHWDIEGDNIVLRAECIFIDFTEEPWSLKPSKSSSIISDKNILPIFVMFSLIMGVLAPPTIIGSIPAALLIHSKPRNSYLIKQSLPDNFTWNDAYYLVSKLNELLKDGDYVAHELAAQKIIGENKDKFLDKVVVSSDVVSALPKKKLKDARRLHELTSSSGSTGSPTKALSAKKNKGNSNVQLISGSVPSSPAVERIKARHANTDRNEINSILKPQHTKYDSDSTEVINELLVHSSFGSFSKANMQFLNVQRRFGALEGNLPSLSFRDNSDLVSCYNEFAYACGVVVDAFNSNIGDGENEVKHLREIMDTIAVVLDRVEHNIVEKRMGDLYVSKNFLAEKFGKRDADTANANLSLVKNSNSFISEESLSKNNDNSSSSNGITLVKRSGSTMVDRNGAHMVKDFNTPDSVDATYQKEQENTAANKVDYYSGMPVEDNEDNVMRNRNE